MKKILMWCLVLGIAGILAYSVAVYVGDNLSPSKTDKPNTNTYQGTAQLSREDFLEFKKYIGQPGVTLEKLAINNNQTEPITVEFIFTVPEDMESPYGEKRRVGIQNATAMAAGLGAFVVVVLIGAAMLNLKGMGGRRWGRH